MKKYRLTPETRKRMRKAQRKAALPKTATFNGRKYGIQIFGPVHGVCDTYGGLYLTLYTELNTRKGLTAAIHEALHACNWVAKEDTVDKVSTDIGRFLWNLGYRIK